MKELVEVLAQALVDHPEEVEVAETETENEILLELKVASDDMGKVIGKQGRIAKAIRTVVKAAAYSTDKSDSRFVEDACTWLCTGVFFFIAEIYRINDGKVLFVWKIILE